MMINAALMEKMVKLANPPTYEKMVCFVSSSRGKYDF